MFSLNKDFYSPIRHFYRLYYMHKDTCFINIFRQFRVFHVGIFLSGKYQLIFIFFQCFFQTCQTCLSSYEYRCYYTRKYYKFPCCNEWFFYHSSPFFLNLYNICILYNIYILFYTYNVL